MQLQQGQRHYGSASTGHLHCGGGSRAPRRASAWSRWPAAAAVSNAAPAGQFLHMLLLPSLSVVATGCRASYPDTPSRRPASPLLQPRPSGSLPSMDAGCLTLQVGGLGPASTTLVDTFMTARRLAAFPICTPRPHPSSSLPLCCPCLPRAHASVTMTSLAQTHSQPAPPGHPGPGGLQQFLQSVNVSVQQAWWKEGRRLQLARVGTSWQAGRP